MFITKTSQQHHHHQSVTDTEQRHHQHKAKASTTYHQDITETRPRHPKCIAIEELAPTHQKKKNANEALRHSCHKKNQKHQAQTLGRKNQPYNTFSRSGNVHDFSMSMPACYFSRVQTSLASREKSESHGNKFSPSILLKLRMSRC